ncbi:MAG: peptidoglycan-binding protein [Pseudomonadota bacterium]
MERLRHAILAAAPDAPDPAIQGFQAARLSFEAASAETPLRLAHLIGQCAHESLRFTHDTESLYYSTPSRLSAVWPRRFPTEAAARPYARDPEKLANKVYGGRRDLGNTEPGDGWRYRGRGYLQLTGRANYTRYGRMLGLDLAADPDKATEPEIAWRIAAAYMHTRRRRGKRLFEWADENNVEQVSRGVNGGLHGLADRRTRTFSALRALGGLNPQPVLKRGASGAEVLLLQRSLALAGFSPRGLDGRFGPGTERAVRAFQRANRLMVDGMVGPKTWERLAPEAS